MDDVKRRWMQFLKGEHNQHGDAGRILMPYEMGGIYISIGGMSNQMSLLTLTKGE